MGSDDGRAWEMVEVEGHIIDSLTLAQAEELASTIITFEPVAASQPRPEGPAGTIV